MEDKPTGRGPDSSIDPATEARVVALVLGEASDFEEDELSRLVAKCPEMLTCFQFVAQSEGEDPLVMARLRMGYNWPLMAWAPSCTGS